jgi:hypothetical protein
MIHKNTYIYKGLLFLFSSIPQYMFCECYKNKVLDACDNIQIFYVIYLIMTIVMKNYQKYLWFL